METSTAALKPLPDDEILTVNKIDEKNKEEIIKEQEEQEKIEDNLMFDKKNISIFKLYCHISGTLEIILSIIAIIMTIGAGCSNSVMNWIFGDSANSFTLGTEIDAIKEILGK